MPDATPTNEEMARACWWSAETLAEIAERHSEKGNSSLKRIYLDHAKGCRAAAAKLRSLKEGER